MSTRTYMLGCLLGTNLLLCSCTKTSDPGSAANSKIVQEVQGAGSGPLDGVDESGMQAWLANHVDVAKQIAPECASATKEAKAQWAQSTEGRLCAADAKVMFFQSKHAYDSFH